MPLDDRERERVKYHLGYTAATTLASIQYGMARPLQTMFLVESALGLLMEVAVDRVRRILKIMDDIELKLIDSQDRLAAIQLDSLKLRENEPDQLEGEYRRWGYRLADLVGCPIYAYSLRYRVGVRSGTIPVR